MHAEAIEKAKAIASDVKQKYRDARASGMNREEAAKQAAHEATVGQGFHEDDRKELESYLAERVGNRNVPVITGRDIQAEAMLAYHEHDGRTGYTHNPLDPADYPDKATSISLIPDARGTPQRADTPVERVYNEELHNAPAEHQDWIKNRAEQDVRGFIREKRFVPKRKSLRLSSGVDYPPNAVH